MFKDKNTGIKSIMNYDYVIKINFLILYFLVEH